uniref:EGF-like domain-containing protein n=1 Tax=Parastrongyloides trichosuri TaxID=131310 RepID=A0A0N4Z414_PARTI
MFNLLTQLIILTLLIDPSIQVPSPKGHESVLFSLTCEPNAFHCTSDDLCLPKRWQCDGDKDCIDGSDEVNCTNPDVTAILCDKKTEFHCSKTMTTYYGDKAITRLLGFPPRFMQCIPRDYVCDGHIDCQNGEDEDNCPDLICSPGTFKCPQTHTDKGSCVPESWKCDGSKDCIDGSDEEGCDTTIKCEENHFKCETGRQCIYKKWVCDGEKDCFDGSDEKNCTKTCNFATHFECKDDSRCLPLHYKCDGESDCTDHSDEYNCTTFFPSNKKNCGQDEFSCGGNTHCISLEWVCDGDIDCPDESDEKGCNVNKCSENQMKCDNVCKPKQLWCNGVVDCNDGEDEKNCKTPEKFKQPCDPTTQYKCFKSANICIDYEYLCTNNFDNSTCWGFACHENIHSCQKGSPNCNCRDTSKNSSVCYCHKGFELSENGRCVDINECKIVGSCDQICLNRPGTFQCGCYHGYQLIPAEDDKKVPHKCRVLGSEPLVLVTNRASIRRYHVDKQIVSGLVEGLHSAVAMDYWHKYGIIAWADLLNEHIMGCQYPGYKPIFNISSCGSGKEKVLVRNITNADGLAFDWVHGLLFWTDSYKKQINVAEIRTGKTKILFNTSLDEPRAIAVDPAAGVIFWTDWGKNPKIERAGIDTKFRTTIVSGEYLKWPNGLTLDILEKKVYFADAKHKIISSCDYWGNNFKTLIHSHEKLKHPYSLAVFEDKIYWSDWDKDAIISANKFTGGNVTEALKHVPSPMTVRVFHEAVQPEYPDKCQTHRCIDLCLPKAHYRSSIEDQKNITNELPYSCVCSEESILIDKKCYPKDAAPSKDSDSIDETVVTILWDVGVFLTFITFLIVYLVYTRHHPIAVRLMRFTSPMYKRTFDEETVDMDEITGRTIINTSRSSLTSDSQLIDNSITNMDPVLNFANPVYTESRE